VPEFLSEMWLRELDHAVRAAAGVSALAPIVIEQVVHAVPGRGEVRYRVRVDRDGACVTVGDAPERPDLRLSTDYDTAVAIALGRESAQIALARGRLRLGGDVDVLVRRADALAELDDATARLRAATTYPPP
jgi:SCP-2 sterol transfer family